MTSADPRYPLSVSVLHWLLAIVILVLVGLGWYMVGIPRNTPPRGYYFNVHKSIGMVAGVLMAVQLWARLRRPPPPLPATMAPWQRRATIVGHWLLYVCIAIVVLSGYVESNFTRFGVRFFGIQMQPWGWEDPRIATVFRTVHRYSVDVLVILLAGHIAAALHHLLVRRDRVVQRILPG